MAWEKLYSTVGWKNKNESETTPLGATLLGRIDRALNEIDNRVIELNKQKAAAGDLDNMITNVSYNKETGVITFTKYSGSVQSFDLSDYISNIEVLVNKASASATTASQKASEATASATSASESAVSAKEDADRAELAAKNAEAVSGVGIATETIAGLMAGGDNAVSENGALMLTKVTTDRTLEKSKAGGLKINSIAGESRQYSGTITDDEGNEITVPNPDYPQDIKSVEVSQVKAVGKNVLNPSLLTNLSVAFNEDKKTFSVIANADKKAFYQTTFKENTAYTISGYVMHTLYNYAGFTVWYTDGTFTSYPNACGVNEFKYVSFTTDATKTVDYIGVRYWGGTCSYKELQIEEGSTATPYEPYQENTINLSSPVTLRGIGDIKDKIIKKDGVFGIERNVEEVVFDGSDDESWVDGESSSVSAYRYRIYLNNIDPTNLGAGTTLRVKCLSNRGLYSATAYTTGVCFIHAQTSNFYFTPDQTITTVAAFKTWLASNNVTVVYMLATPVFEALPDADQIALHQLETFDTVTYISTDSEIEPVIEVEYGTSKAGAYALKGMLTAEANALQIAQLNTLTNELATQLV